jgi:hypothetical protein
MASHTAHAGAAALRATVPQDARRCELGEELEEELGEMARMNGQAQRLAGSAIGVVTNWKAFCVSKQAY